MANNANIDKVIASIKGEQELTKAIGFNMDSYAQSASESIPDHTGRHCGTVACIAGHAYFLATGEDKVDRQIIYSGHLETVARKFLGMNSDDAEELFNADGADHDLRDITPEHAIATLQYFKKTGAVDWIETDPDPRF